MLASINDGMTAWQTASACSCEARQVSGGRGASRVGGLCSSAQMVAVTSFTVWQPGQGATSGGREGDVEIVLCSAFLCTRLQ